MVKKQNKRKQIVSLLSMLAMALVFFVVVGIMINWNLFIVIGCFIPILLIGLGIIILPDYFVKAHRDLSGKIEKKIDSYGKKISQ